MFEALIRLKTMNKHKGCGFGAVRGGPGGGPDRGGGAELSYTIYIYGISEAVYLPGCRVEGGVGWGCRGPPPPILRVGNPFLRVREGFGSGSPRQNGKYPSRTCSHRVMNGSRCCRFWRHCSQFLELKQREHREAAPT